MPSERGTHQRLNSSGSRQASNTSRGGASNIRVTTSSRSDLRSTVVRCFTAPLPLPASIDLLLAFQFLDDVVQRAETRVPELVVALDPGGDFRQAAHTELAVADPTHLLGDHQPRLLQHADVLLHAGERH